MPDKSFKICLTMAGAVSAGAYTAGVLDELLGVLDRWEKAKSANRKRGTDHPDYDHSIPMHEVQLEVLSGASAGGITAALALKKIMDGDCEDMESNSLLKDCWVTMADDPEKNTLEKLLDTTDLPPGESPQSLLNASAIDALSERHLAPLKNLKKPAWISNSPEVILTTTNLDGIAVNIHFNGSVPEHSEHTITQHSSVFRFTPFVTGVNNHHNSNAYRYVADLRKKADTDLLKNAVLSTSAFPIGLPTRRVHLPHRPYLKYFPKDPSNSNLHIDPVNTGKNLPFAAIDGGLLNNEPYGWALKILRENCKDACRENRYAVIMIDPLSSKAPNPIPENDKGLWNTFTAMFRALRNEVMLNQEGLADAISLIDRTKFLIAPRKGSDYPPKLNAIGKVLASAPIGGFAGFISKKQRAHDYELGRRNCRDFIRFHFTIPLSQADHRLGQTMNTAMQDRFCIIPRNEKPGEALYFPLIPDIRLEKARTQKLNKSWKETREYPELPEFDLHTFIKTYQPLLNKRLITLVKRGFGKWWITILFRIFILRRIRKHMYAAIESEMSFFSWNKNTGKPSDQNT